MNVKWNCSRKLYRFVSFSLICLYALTSLSSGVTYANEDDTGGRAAIVIDDFGGVGKGTKEFFESDIPITVAVMPFLENSKEQAEKAHELGFEVIIHLPMEPKKGKKSWLGPKPITADLSLEEVHERMEAAIEEVPHAKGINQHMGSKVVENKDIVKTILDVADDHNLYVIDSGTNPNSYMPPLAEEMEIPYAERDLFLDDSHSSEAHVYKMAKKLVKLANKQGEALAIGHVGVKGMDTFHGLKKALPLFEEKGVEIVPASMLMKTEVEKDPEDFWES